MVMMTKTENEGYDLLEVGTAMDLSQLASSTPA